MELIKALGKVQQELRAPKDCYNDFAKFSYRNAEAILETVKPLLVNHGLVLVLTDDMINLGDRYYLKATAKLLLGEETFEVSAFAREELSLKGQIAAQISGGCSSYARKYALSGLFCIDEGKKDPDSQDNSNNDAPEYIAPELPGPLYEVYEYALSQYNDGNLQGVGDCFEGFELKEEMVAVWKMLDSKQRAAIKKFTSSDQYVKKEIKKEKHLNDFQHSKFMKDFNLN